MPGRASGLAGLPGYKAPGFPYVDKVVAGQGRQGRRDDIQLMGGLLKTGTKAPIYILAVLATALIVSVTYETSLHRNVARSQERFGERLTAYKSMLLSSIAKYEYLPSVITENRYVLRLLEHRATQAEASEALKLIQRQSGAQVVYVMDSNGTTLASSNYDDFGSFVGKNYAYREYFTQAMQGWTGTLFAVGATSGLPGYYLSSPIHLGGAIAGVAVVKIDLSDIENVWRKSSEIVFVSDKSGVVIFSSIPAWSYTTTTQLTPLALRQLRRAFTYGTKSLAPLGLKFRKRGEASLAVIDGTSYLIVQSRIESLDWNIHYLEPWSELTGKSRDYAGLAIVCCLLAISIILLLREHRLKEVSEQQLARAERLREIDRQREESLRLLAGSIAHQIRNPMLGIGGNANLIRRKHQDDNALQEHVDVILDCCTSLEAIVAAVREFIRLVPGPQERVDISKVVTLAVKQSQLYAEERKIAVDWYVQLEPAQIETDPQIVKWALFEVLKNAVDSNDSQPVSIRVEGIANRQCPEQDKSQEHWACYTLSISDSGLGIDAESLPHVMEPFFSLKPHGVGMGLAKANRIIQNLHGSIEITSPVPDAARGTNGTGTLVRIQIPLPQAD